MTAAANAAATPRHTPPSRLLLLTEGQRAIAELALLPLAAPLLAAAPKGDGHPVMVLPGFITGDRSTGILRRFLASKGYDARKWELGRNLGPRAIGRDGERLLARLEDIYAETGRKVSLVGWSLGGTMARQLSRRAPHMVRQVIALGSPIVGDPRATNAWRAYQAFTGQKVRDPDTMRQLAESERVPPVPSTAIYSKSDGIVAWRNSLEPDSPTTQNIEVYGSHCGLGVNGTVLAIIADRLAQPEDGWKRFAHRPLSRLFYPAG